MYSLYFYRLAMMMNIKPKHKTIKISTKAFFLPFLKCFLPPPPHHGCGWQSSNYKQYFYQNIFFQWIQKFNLHSLFLFCVPCFVSFLFVFIFVFFQQNQQSKIGTCRPQTAMFWFFLDPGTMPRCNSNFTIFLTVFSTLIQYICQLATISRHQELQN